MDTEIPLQLQWLAHLAPQWPQGSADGMRQLADHFYSHAAALADVIPDLQRVRGNAQQALTGATAEAADRQLLGGVYSVDKLVDALRVNGQSAEIHGAEIQYTKRQMTTTLAIAHNSIIRAVLNSERTGHASLAQIPIIKQLAEYSNNKAASDAVGRIEAALANKPGSTLAAQLPVAGALADTIGKLQDAGIVGAQIAHGHPGRFDIGDVLHSALSTDPTTGIQLATQHGAGAGAGAGAGTQVHRIVPLHEVHTGSLITRDVVNVSVNGGSKVPVVVDTGSNGLVLPVTDIGLQNLGSLTGFHEIRYGSDLGGQTEGVLTFNAPINLGNGIVTAPTQVTVPLYSDVHLHVGPLSPSLPVPFVPPFTDFLLGGAGIHGILGIGPSATGPSPQPLLSALPAPLNQGVLINAPAGYLEFGPSPLSGGVSVPGSPISTLDVQINHGPLVPLTTAIDSGGVNGDLPASVLGHNSVPIIDIPHVGSFGETVAPGTDIRWYDSRSHTLLAQTTTTDRGAPGVVPEGDIANTGIDLFRQGPVYIGNGPNPGSPGPSPFLPNRGTTIFYPGRR